MSQFEADRLNRTENDDEDDPEPAMMDRDFDLDELYGTSPTFPETELDEDDIDDGKFEDDTLE